MSVIEQVDFATWQSAHTALCHCNNVAKKIVLLEHLHVSCSC